jgi:methionyl-tRNA synthetase
MQQAATASQDQVREYIASLQAENMNQVKDYFQLTSNEQKKYMENLLVDFAQYLQQQRNNDLQIVQSQMQSLEQNTNIFKKETEQILTGIISSVRSNENPAETKN